MGYKENLKSNLEQLMRQHGVTYEALAEKTGVSRSSINRIRMSKSNPTVETLSRICRFFNVSLQEITGMEVIKKDYPISLSMPRIEKAAVNYQSRNIQLVSWDDLSAVHAQKTTTRNKIQDSIAKLFAVPTPQEYINIPPESILIFDINRKPQHGDFVLVKEKKTHSISVVEYIRDLAIEYVRSCFPQNLRPHELPLVPLHNFQVLGVVLEARKIFIPHT